MYKLILVPFTGILLAFLPSCKKDKDQINISGFLITDAFGNTITNVGNTDDDWRLRDWSSLSSFEQSLFAFADTVSLNGTLVSNVQTHAAYPNPVSSTSALSFSSADSVKLKIVLVDSKGQQLASTALKFKGSKAIQFNVSQRDLFPLGKSLRYYYSFSAAAQQNFKVGYGDIKVCASSNFMDCF